MPKPIIKYLQKFHIGVVAEGMEHLEQVQY